MMSMNVTVRKGRPERANQDALPLGRHAVPAGACGFREAKT
jgi:hypothetical protein